MFQLYNYCYYCYHVTTIPSFVQELILLRAVRDVNVPKFLQDDLKLFSGIVSDLFPKIEDVPVDYGELEQSIRDTSLSKGLQDVEGWY